jgi:hypothetical protein
VNCWDVRTDWLDGESASFHPEDAKLVAVVVLLLHAAAAAVVVIVVVVLVLVVAAVCSNAAHRQELVLRCKKSGRMTYLI